MQRDNDRIIEELQEEIDHYQLIFDYTYGATVVVDPDGYIIDINKPYLDFLDVSYGAIIGTHCTKILGDSRLHIVAQTGKAEMNQVQTINNQQVLARRIPVKQGGKVVAAVGQVIFEDIRQIASLARKYSLLESKVKHYEQELRHLRSTRYSFDSIVGESKPMHRIKKEALTATSNSFPVLITGESGTGKEIFAQAIHHESRRSVHPFIRINCAAIPRELMESELFGYEKGAFTGARNDGKPGKFEMAHRGTIFLDEIGELPLEMQPKLLRVLEEKEFERVGGTRVIRSDFRLIAATNRNLAQMVSEGSFRSDLYYRINVIHLHLPALRKRREDIPLLSRHLLGLIADKEGLHGVSLSPDAEELLSGYTWPGNVRELSNCLERAVASMAGSALTEDDLPFCMQQFSERKETLRHSSLKEALNDAEKNIISATLQEESFNKAKAARRLGIHRTLLYKKIDKYGISAKSA
ncbi:sigma-54 interaction domain-containing protein [Desulfoluna spongiiphila]|uniref:Transcriptional regulator containing PAS, AAA-type ATPase, and DNA-binding Fis domains n=1 Tax=Desulfoluna spongiiphila TaxID=419481 RepID=A0A1G5EZD6_9BACT|nr:sigma 54-interacting transcriptional regulator [Desulfoluna spongiiphila]SCY32385.1 Transcriptional regulator containing PAS, AAA-type ATPase, and DNA-binding Fis domains [Desulfoluna spongiiphila]VVS94422.1 rna polymerase sigma factor 54 interaction domain [Desulfoluna spongiiphila]